MQKRAVLWFTGHSKAGNLKCSQDVRLKRDEKAKYKRYPSTIHYYEEPVNPDIIIETDQCSSDCAAGKIMNFLTSKGYINRKTG